MKHLMIGDTVKIKDRQDQSMALLRRVGSLIVIDKMRELCSSEVTINGVLYENGQIKYYIKEDRGAHLWDEDMFSLGG